MASNTENLNLLMKNPSTDGADTFNVQTMLNENWQKIDDNAGTVAQTLANILKPTTPPIIGLPPSTTPDGMFRALGNTGELHVWRKTVTTSQAIPAGYTLGEVQNVTKYPITDVRSGGYTIVTKAYSNLSVDDAGNVSVDESSYVNFYDDTSAVRGKFIQVHSDEDILFIPNDANISTDYKTVGSAVIHNHYTDKYQTVTGYPLIPAGTTTTYPVSTNPNAYQEGDDAKPAGYVVGDVVTGAFRFATNSNHSVWYHVSDSLNVADDGAISLGAYERESMRGGMDYNSSTIAGLKGKFIRLESNDYAKYVGLPFSNLGIYYIPSDAVFSGGPATDRYQPVTGYAAIPAGTTIEYLGKLGDKTRVQVVSYVGTGTYGSDHPNSLTFDFVPKVVMIRCDGDANFFDAIYGMREVVTDISAGRYVTVKWSKKTLSWYSVYDSWVQMNDAGDKYYTIAIG